jgi:hypothetical protein
MLQLSPAAICSTLTPPNAPMFNALRTFSPAAIPYLCAMLARNLLYCS